MTAGAGTGAWRVGCAATGRLCDPNGKGGAAFGRQCAAGSPPKTPAPSYAAGPSMRAWMSCQGSRGPPRSATQPAGLRAGAGEHVLRMRSSARPPARQRTAPHAGPRCVGPGYGSHTHPRRWAGGGPPRVGRRGRPSQRAGARRCRSCRVGRARGGRDPGRRRKTGAGAERRRSEAARRSGGLLQATWQAPPPRRLCGLPARRSAPRAHRPSQRSSPPTNATTWRLRATCGWALGGARAGGAASTRIVFWWCVNELRAAFCGGGGGRSTERKRRAGRRMGCRTPKARGHWQSGAGTPTSRSGGGSRQRQPGPRPILSCTHTHIDPPASSCPPRRPAWGTART